MELKTFTDESVFISASIRFIKAAGKNIGLSGGQTPLPIYAALAPIRSGFKFFQIDERYVPRDNKQSNYHSILPLVDSTTHLFDTSLPITEALNAYEAELISLDLCILGLGDDGHTASLFPHSLALHEEKRLVAHTTTDRFAVHDRLTLTFPAIMNSKHILLLLKGKEKQLALGELLHGTKTMDEFPAKKLLEHPSLTIHYFS